MLYHQAKWLMFTILESLQEFQTHPKSIYILAVISEKQEHQCAAVWPQTRTLAIPVLALFERQQKEATTDSFWIRSRTKFLVSRNHLHPYVCRHYLIMAAAYATLQEQEQLHTLVEAWTRICSRFNLHAGLLKLWPKVSETCISFSQKEMWPSHACSTLKAGVKRTSDFREESFCLTDDHFYSMEVWTPLRSSDCHVTKMLQKANTGCAWAGSMNTIRLKTRTRQHVWCYNPISLH